MKEDCGNNKPCGCEDEHLTTPPPCESGTPECPDPDRCPETFAQECVVWTGEDLECNGTLFATAGDRMDVVLQRLVSFICNNPGGTSEAGVNLTVPAPNESIIGLTDRIIALDRNNCHETITFTPNGAPAGLVFDYTDENGVVQAGQADVVLAPAQSAVVFDMDVSAVEAGDYNFTLEATACGSTLIANVFITVP